MAKVAFFSFVSAAATLFGAYKLLDTGHPHLVGYLFLAGLISALVFFVTMWLISLPVRMAERLVEGERPYRGQQQDADDSDFGDTDY